MNCVNTEHCTRQTECFNTRPRIYRLMIENAAIKRKDQNGSVEGGTKIATIFIRFFCHRRSVRNKTLSCTMHILFVRNNI